MKIGICDDDIEDIYAIEKLIKSYEKELENIDIFRLDNDAYIIDRIREHEIEVLLLDIDMPKRDGIEIGDELSRETNNPNLIFITNRDDLVFRAIHCQPYRFIRKSHMEEELEEALFSVAKKLAYEQILFCFDNKGADVKLRIRDIMYVESNLHYIVIHGKNNTCRVRGKMREYENRLRELGFIRIHHSYLVNVRFIQKITSAQVILDTGELLNISRKYSQSARDEYNRGVKVFINGIHI